MFLVTGGAGFIGSHLVEHLLNRGESVRVLDDFSTGKRENLAPFQGRFEMIEGSLTEPETVARAMAGVNHVLHQAAIPSVPRSIANPLATNNANVTGTLNVLVAARDAGVRRLVMASSSSVYGDSPTLPKKEDMPANPKSIYAASKLIGEHYARVFSTVFGLSVVCLRYFNVFGPRQDPDSEYAAVIPKFIRLIHQGESPPAHGDGMQTRDFTYIDNVALANIQAATADALPPFLVCNIACGQRVSIIELIQRINRILGKSVQPSLTDARAGDVKHSLADISLAKESFGYKPLITLDQGLEKTIAYLTNPS
jgi:nucleoside-diphosphate-sugar epimerase